VKNINRQPEIPRADLEPGIVRCFVKARALLESALVLVDSARSGRVDAGANLFLLAAQEIGRAKLLRDGFDAGQPQSKITSFSNHDAKIESATSVLGSTAMWLKSGAFQKGRFDQMSLTLRCRLMSQPD
jgi:hypothetical protein